jgi:glyoxylase I family protein
MIKSLAHMCFVVRDLNKSLEFYRDKLGMKVGFDFINDKGVRFGVYLKVGGRSFIELFQGTVTPDTQYQSFRHFALEVEDIQTTVAHCKAVGIEVTEPKLGSDNAWQAWIKDPDGNNIEFHAYLPNSKQTLALKQ